jgi:HK97 family phage major capsid protein
MAYDVNELKAKRNKLVEEMRAFNDQLVEREGETSEEGERFAKYEKDIRALETIIHREETIQEAEAKSAAVAAAAHESKGVDKWDGIIYPKNSVRVLNPQELERRKVLAVQGWLMMQKPSLRELITEEHRTAAAHFRFSLDHKEICLPIAKDYRAIQNRFLQEKRAGLTLVAGEGGYTVAEDFSGALEKSLLAFGGMRQVSRVRRTSTGADMPWPTMNDTTNKGVILNEATTIGTSVDPSFGVVTFKAFKYSSKPILISTELLQDSAFDLAAEIGEALGTRIGRIQNDHFTTGGGTTLPKGVVVSSGEGSVGAGYAVTADEIITLLHSLDPAYRTNATFMMHDAVLAQIRLLKFAIGADSIGYVWQGSFQNGLPDRILGYPYVINQSMTNVLTVAEKAILFGDFSKYVIRDVADVRLVRMDERYADLDQVAFVAFMRSDGQLLDAGTDPVKHFVTKKT